MVSGWNLYLSTDSGTTWSQQASPDVWGCIALSADGETMFGAAIGTDGYAYSIFKSQTPPHPHLSLTLSGSGPVLSWLVPSTDFVLEESGDLSKWSEVRASQALNYTNLNYEVHLPGPTSPTFYRLAQQ
jgi:hypothetical protein